MRRLVRYGLLSAGMALTAGTSALAQGELVLSTSGGVVAEATTKIFVPLYEKETGIKVKQVASETTRMAEIEAMVRAGKPIWDVSEISNSNYPIGVKKGLLEEINYDLVDPERKLPEVARAKYGVVTASYSTVLMVNTSKFPAGKSIASWADFWDTKTFPGPRSLRNGPEYNLEFALLADGVPKADLYDVLRTKEGVDRAFAKLDEIKDNIPVWWSSGAQSVQLLTDGEVNYATNYNGRVVAMQQAGLPAEVVWNGGALHTTYLGIIKGTQNLEAAHAYLKLRATDPELQRQYLDVLPYPGMAPGLSELLPEEKAKGMPNYPANIEAQFAADEEFWSDHIDELRQRWEEWLLE